MRQQQTNEKFLGFASGVGAYVLWGILPLYWKIVDTVPSQEILAHRIAWSFVLMIFILLVTGKLMAFWGELRTIISQPKKLFGIITAATLITINWGLYIWAVNNNRIIETSLGYYINPLVSVLLGIIVLKEKLSFWQLVSLLLATLGVLNITLHFGNIPWISLTLAVTFGLYGLVKKMVNLGAITAITVETLLICPFALMYLAYIHKVSNGAFGLDNPLISIFLIGAGIVTAVPLILFSTSTNRLPLSIVGFLQYIAPSIALCLGVFIFHEPFSHVHLVSFTFIWGALTVFSLAKTKTFIQLEAMLFKKAALNKEA